MHAAPVKHVGADVATPTTQLKVDQMKVARRSADNTMQERAKTRMCVMTDAVGTHSEIAATEAASGKGDKGDTSPVYRRVAGHQADLSAAG